MRLKQSTESLTHSDSQSGWNVEEVAGRVA